MRRFDRLTALPPLEFALAVECGAPAADRAATAKQFADKIDWTRFLALCRRHRIQGVVWRAIERFGRGRQQRVAEAWQDLIGIRLPATQLILRYLSIRSMGQRALLGGLSAGRIR